MYIDLRTYKLPQYNSRHKPSSTSSIITSKSRLNIPSTTTTLTIKMRLRPTLSEDGVQYYKEKAQEEFPALGPDESLAAYVKLDHTKDLFFHDKDGKRCVWREGK